MEGTLFCSVLRESGSLRIPPVQPAKIGPFLSCGFFLGAMELEDACRQER